MESYYVRTEDLKAEQVSDLFVETDKDRKIVNAIKSHQPVILEGSRGVGKSFLFKVAQAELKEDFNKEKVLPVYVTFNKSSLISTDDEDQFVHWMTARICSNIVRSLNRYGLLTSTPRSVGLLSGGSGSDAEETNVEKIASAYERSWDSDIEDLDLDILPTPTTMKQAVEDICRYLDISSINLLIDEAAHVFLPEQQRQFFTLFRDLRSPYLTCNAAVYPGVTSYGESFEPTHDANMHTLVRDPMSQNYVSTMQEMVTRQVDDDDTLQMIAHRQDNFSILAYASSGNPRTLLKTFRRGGLSGNDVNNTVREYYRTDIWSEHSSLSEKYPNHRPLIDWGREFIENKVLKSLKNKNDRYLDDGDRSTAFFWIHRDSPQQVKESLRLLTYTGVVRSHSEGIKASRSRIGTRYMVNLGCLFALEPKPTSTSLNIASNLTPKRMTEYGENHESFRDLIDKTPDFNEVDTEDALERQIDKSIDVLDLTNFKKRKLRNEVGIETIGEVLRASESDIQQAYYMGEKRSRRVKNTAYAAVMEYLSG